MTTLESSLDLETDLTFTRRINAPLFSLWKCWPTPDHVKHFFVPKPHSIEKCGIDLRVGGRFNTTINVDGKLMESEGVYLEVEEGKRLAFTDAYSEGWKPAANPFITAIIDFEDNSNGGTSYTATAQLRSPEA